MPSQTKFTSSTADGPKIIPGDDDAHRVVSKRDGEINDEVDVAAQILAAAGDHSPITQAEMDAVRWKIDWHMVPMLFVCLQLSGWDKVV